MDFGGFLGSSAYVQMLITIILKIEKLIIIAIRIKSKNPYVIYTIHTTALMATEPYMLISGVRDML